MNNIEGLLQALQDDWEYAGQATSGGEGMARMTAVRETQMKLAKAYLEASEGAEAPTQVQEFLAEARKIYVEVFSSREGRYHKRHLPLLRQVLARLTEPSAPVFLEMAEKTLAQLEFFAARKYRSPDFAQIAEYMTILIEDVEGGPALLERLDALR